MLPTLVLLMLACSRGVTQHTTIHDAREALRAGGIACVDFPIDKPAVAACSFHESVPEPGLASGFVVIYETVDDAATAEARCRGGGTGEGQLLYRDGQGWVGVISAVADDRVTNSRIDDQAFVTRIAELLGTDVIDC